MNPTIEYAVSGDLHSAELGDLLNSASRSVYSQRELTQIISGSTAYVTARDAGKLVGFGRMLSDGAVLAYINNMAVSPTHQGQGIGQTVLNALVDAAGDVKSIYLYTDTADALYLRNDFQRSEKRLYVRRRVKAV